VRIIKSLTVAVVATGVLLAAGCSSGDDSGSKKDPGGASTKSSAPTAAESAAAAAATTDLNAAVQELTKTSYKYSMKAGDASGTGTMDPTVKQSSMTITVAEFKTEVLIIEPDLFARISGLPLTGVDAKKWLRIDRTKIKSFGALGIRDVNDPTGVNTLAKTIATIQKTGDKSYKGTLDLSKGSDAFGLDEAAVRQLAEKSRTVRRRRPRSSSPTASTAASSRSPSPRPAKRPIRRNWCTTCSRSESGRRYARHTVRPIRSRRSCSCDPLRKVGHRIPNRGFDNCKIGASR
jgi:hypothetical protein